MANTFKNAGVAIGTSATTLYTAPAGTTGIIHAIYISNVDGTNDVTVRVAFVNNGTTHYLAYDVDCIAKTTLIVLSKDQAIYLEENDSISASATVASDAQIIISYETLID